MDEVRVMKIHAQVAGRWLLGTAAGLVVMLAGASQSRIGDRPPRLPAGPTPQEIFADRIMPIFRSPNPSSCTQCHLADVEDLKHYIRPSHEETFAALRDEGLID